jgi:hypothetical protein
MIFMISTLEGPIHISRYPQILEGKYKGNSWQDLGDYVFDLSPNEWFSEACSEAEDIHLVNDVVPSRIFEAEISDERWPLFAVLTALTIPRKPR